MTTAERRVWYSDTLAEELSRLYSSVPVSNSLLYTRVDYAYFSGEHSIDDFFLSLIWMSRTGRRMSRRVDEKKSSFPDNSQRDYSPRTTLQSMRFKGFTRAHGKTAVRPGELPKGRITAHLERDKKVVY